MINPSPLPVPTPSDILSAVSTTTDDVPPESAEPKPDLGRAFAVVEIAGVLKFKSVAVAKESSKALFLDDSLLLPSSNQPKRLLIKGNDMIARSEKEAMQQYIEYLKAHLNELEAAKAHTVTCMETARGWLVSGGAAT